MILSLLYHTTILQHNKHRETILYVVSSIIYVILHWILFSSIGDKNKYVQKYRHILYAIVACDLIYVGIKQKKMCDTIKQAKNRMICDDTRCYPTQHYQNQNPDHDVVNNDKTQNNELIENDKQNDDIKKDTTKMENANDENVKIIRNNIGLMTKTILSKSVQ